MKILLIRHLKVIAKTPFFLTATQFDAGRVIYDNADIEATDFKISTVDFPLCFVSPKKRALETAKLIYAGKYLVRDELVEVLNAGVFVKMTSLPAVMRSIIGRIAWYFNNSDMPETRMQSTARAEKFISELLSKTDQNAIVISHGFFMHLLQKQLRKNGFKGRISFIPKNGHPYIFERK